MRFLLISLLFITSLAQADLSFLVECNPAVVVGNSAPDGFEVQILNTSSEITSVVRGPTCPIRISIPDESQYLAVTLSAYNEAGQSARIGPEYWVPEQDQEPIEVKLPPGTPILINLILEPEL